MSLSTHSATAAPWCEFNHRAAVVSLSSVGCEQSCFLFFFLNILLLVVFFQDPEPLSYLQDPDPYTFNINLFVSIKGTALTDWLELFSTYLHHTWMNIPTAPRADHSSCSSPEGTFILTPVSAPSSLSTMLSNI